MENSFVLRKREYQRNWMRNRRAEYFNGKSCNHCGSIHELELDHIDPTKKVSHKIWSWSAARREAELAKCQVLCSDCHAKKTAAERPKPKHGGGMYKHGCRCHECVQWNRDRVARGRGKPAGHYGSAETLSPATPPAAQSSSTKSCKSG